MRFHPRIYIPFVMSGGFFILDRYLKWATLYTWTNSHLFTPYFGWQPFLNPGIAFGIPVPNKLIILITLPILTILAYSGWIQLRSLFHKKPSFLEPAFLNLFGFVCIFLGALSNLIDRITLQNTVDYLLIFTGIINLADVLIVVGFVFYFYSSLKTKQ